MRSITRRLGVAFLAFVFCGLALAQTSFSTQQLQTLKAAILADATLTGAVAVGDWPAVAIRLNEVASPAFIVWRTNVTRGEIYHQTSAEGTTWSWTTYKAQSQAEQGAWTQMFMGDQANFALPNLRAGIGAIFGAANAQTIHALAIAKRSAKYGEKALASGTGTLASPATMGFEGDIQPADVAAAMK